jgi:alginate O-acetyltransferase complex protein AlgI
MAEWVQHLYAIGANIVEWICFFNPEKPVQFTQFEFWIFLCVVMGSLSLLHKRIAARNFWLFGVSLFFYFKTSGLFFLLLIFSTVSDFIIGDRIFKAKPGRVKTLWLSLSVALNLGALVYFKYAYFFTDLHNSLFQTNYEVINWLAVWGNTFISEPLTGSQIWRADYIMLPVGVSFFTFQTISYAVDIYRGRLTPVQRISDFGFYVSFFPQLVAGPIVRAAEFVPQLYRPYRISRNLFGLALFFILNGLLKKMLLSDFLAGNFVDKVFSLPHQYQGFEIVMALFAYSLQIYADFSGYTDIAIGVALLMGFRLPVNFNSPYKATSASDFWKRWHISLSTWLKDYLYIPLGGNRKASFGTFFWLLALTTVAAALADYWWLLLWVGLLVGFWWILGRRYAGLWKHFVQNINILLTMLIGGLWHGASWNFLIWGGLNGLGMLVQRQWARISPYEKSNLKIVRAWKIFNTFVFISFTRLFFRAGDIRNPNDPLLTAQVLWERIFLSQGWQLSFIRAVCEGYALVFSVFVIGMLIHWISVKGKRRIRVIFIRLPLWAQLLTAVLSVFIIYQFVVSGGAVQTFVYFQF